MRHATLAFLLTALLLAGMNGCHKEEPSIPASGEKANLVFWHIQTTAATKDVIEGAVARFEATGTVPYGSEERGQSPGVAVEATAFKNDPFKQKLSPAMAGGAPPDVFHTWGGGLLESYARQGHVADLTALVDASGLRERLLSAAVKFGTLGGKVYAVPNDVAVVVMWYNRDLFAQHGVTVPKTMDELFAACDKLSAAGVTPIALGNKDKWPGAFYFVYLATRIGGTQAFRSAASRAPGASFADPCFVRAGETLLDLAVTHKAFSKGANVLTTDDARSQFVRGKAAMTLMGTWFLAEVRGDDAAMLDRIDCFAFPAVAGGAGDAGAIVGGINCAFAVSSGCARPDDAFALIREMTTDETAKAWAATGRIPALRREVVEPMLDANTLKAARLLFDAPEIQLYYDQFLPPKLAEMHKTSTQSLIGGMMTAEQAAKDMEALAAQIEARSAADTP